jgi:NTP pyrophosphatase (non-canonical NTP hydrolase)
VSDLEPRLREFAELFPGRDDERWVRAVAEEAGEVLGAFNKWHDGNRLKPRTRQDVLEEIAQLLACTFILAAKLGVSVDDLLELADQFMARKVRQIRLIRAHPAAGQEELRALLESGAEDGAMNECEEDLR